MVWDGVHKFYNGAKSRSGVSASPLLPMIGGSKVGTLTLGSVS